MILASLDLGTNTFRLLVARITRPGVFEELYSEQRIVRLGEGLLKGGRLQPHAIARGLDTLKRFRTVIDQYEVAGVATVATSAVREAANGSEFVETVHEETGIGIRVITAGEEARLTFLGVMTGFQDLSSSLLVLDIGGGSTEFMWGDQNGLAGLKSTDLGVVRLTERYLSSYPVPDQDLQGLKAFIHQRIDEVKSTLSSGPPAGVRPAQMVGTAGTITTLAAMDQGLVHYDPKRVQHYRLSLATIERIYEILSGKAPAERLSIPGLEKGREDLIVPGTLILLTGMRTLGYSGVTVSDYGLREGILVDTYQKKSGQVQRPMRHEG